MEKNKKFKYSKPVLFLGGMMVLILGLVLVLVWWKDVVVLFRGCVGVFIALAGLMMLFVAQQSDG